MCVRFTCIYVLFCVFVCYSADELLLTEMMFNGLFNDLTAEQATALLSCFVFQENVTPPTLFGIKSLFIIKKTPHTKKRKYIPDFFWGGHCIH